MDDNSTTAPQAESDYSRQTVRGRGLRTGYTTGSCAAAAAKAAVTALLTGQTVDRVTIHLPVGSDVEFPVHRCETSADGRAVLCSVIKDGGDDPDVTHGAEIRCTVSLDPDTPGEVKIQGGPGVGKVTMPGTGIEVGEPAVTRVPRRMIIESALAAVSAHGPASGTGITVEISVPGGEEIAKKTTNARLGVLGAFRYWAAPGSYSPIRLRLGAPASIWLSTLRPPTACPTWCSPPEPAARNSPSPASTCPQWPTLRPEYSAALPSSVA